MTRARFAAVALALDLDRAESLTTFRAAIAELLDEHVEPHPTAPTVVAFPEHTGLLAAFVGTPGRAARAQLAAGATAVEALGELADGHAGSLEHTARRFPEVESLGALLQLALTDTLVRAVHETFSSLAAERGLWLSVGAAVPSWQTTSDPQAVTAIAADGDRSEVYVATAPEVRNRNLVYGPDGSLVAVQDKAYLVPMERDRIAGLGLTGCGLEEVTVASLPVGRVASVISKDAWMPDVNERLGQLGAEVLLQPEAFDRWSLVDREGGLTDLWPPDKLQRGGWWMLQRHRGLFANVTPMLLGRLGDLVFDGQPLVAVPTPGGRPGLGLAGQLADGGWAAVGGYGALPDPPADLADPRRRGELEDWARSRQMAGDESVQCSEGAVWADVTVPPTHPPVSPPPGVDAPPSVAVAPGEDVQLVPDLVAGDDRAWLAFVSCRGEVTQGVGLVEGDGRSWASPRILDPQPPRTTDQFDRRWRPRLALVGRGGPLCAYLGFPHESWDMFVIPTREGAAPIRVDDADERDGVLRERGHDAACLIADPRRPGRVVAVWSDLRWPWVLPQVRWAVSNDGGDSWSASRRVDDGELEGEPDPLRPRSHHETRGQTEPSAVLAPELVVAWQERDEDGWPTIWLAGGDDGAPGLDRGARGDDGGGPRRLSPPGVAAYRPRLAAHGTRVWVVWEQQEPDGGGGLWWSVRVGAGFTPPARVSPADRAGHVQRHAAVCALDATSAVVVAADERAGVSQIVAARLGVASAGPEARVCDTPPAAHARAPSLARLADRLLVAWQDTRDGEHIRARSVPLTALSGPTAV